MEMFKLCNVLPDSCFLKAQDDVLSESVLLCSCYSFSNTWPKFSVDSFTLSGGFSRVLALTVPTVHWCVALI